MAITGTQQANSPRIIFRGNVRTVERVYKYQYQQNWEAEMPAQGTLEADGYFIGYEAIRQTPVYTTVRATWSADQNWQVIFQPSDGDTVYYAESRGLDTPLEQHPDFKMKWTWDLYQKENYDAALPAWAATVISSPAKKERPAQRTPGWASLR